MKKFMTGLILGAGLMFSVSAYAEEVVNYVGMTIEGQFPVTVDGVKIEEPGLVVNGTSYLPSRKIAEMFNSDVTFDADLGIEINSKASKTAPPDTTSGQSPEFKRYLEIDNELVNLGDDLLKIQDQISGINIKEDLSKAQGGVLSAEDSQKREELTQKSAELEAQVEALKNEKAALEAQLAAQ